MFGKKFARAFVLLLFGAGILVILVSTSSISKVQDYETTTHDERIHVDDEKSDDMSRTTENNNAAQNQQEEQQNNDPMKAVEQEQSNRVSKDHYRKVIEMITSNNKEAIMPSCIKKKEFCKYDDVGDFLEGGIGTGIIHEPISVVPSSRRIPFEKANDWPYILDQRAKLPEDGSLTALMDYNCVLLPLYKNKKQADGTFIEVSDLEPGLLDHITGRYHPYFSNEEADKVKYLSISRTSNLHSCKPKFKFFFGTLAQDFLGLSLLDKNLAPIDGTGVAINVDKWILGNMTAYFHDFQVIPVRTRKEATLKDQLMLFPSGHLGTFVFPIDIRRVPPQSESSQYESIPWETKFRSMTIPFSQEFMYGDGMEIKIQADNSDLKNRKPHTRGDKLFDIVGIDRGKNFHFFEIGEGTHSKTFMEFWPHGPHKTVPINFFIDVNETHPFVTSDQMLKKKRDFVKKLRYQVEFLEEIESHGGTFSWNTSTPKHERPKKKFRGTSQLIDFELHGRNVKLGISHTVSEHWPGHVDKRGYLSHFYAFKPEPPFDIVAMSGHFCFNHMHEEDVGYDAQWISKRPIENRTAPILLLDKNYRCPIITFASGLTEMIGHDGEYVIISYGVNDCYSRSLVVPKKKIEMLLMPGFG